MNEDNKSNLDFNKMGDLKQKKIKIGTNFYDLNFSIRMREFEEIIQCISNDFNDFNEVTNDLLMSYFVGVDNIQEINLSDADIKNIIEENLKNDKLLYETWNKIDEENFKKKYLIAIQQKSTTIIAEALKEALQEALQIDEKTKKAFMIGVTNFLENFADAMTSLLSQLNNTFANLIKSVDIPGIDDVQKKKLEVAYRKWGEYGWTFLPDGPIDFFENIPDTQMEADKLALNYCTDNNMCKLYKMLRSTERISQVDLEEAIYVYEHKKYKSCVLIIFSLIDGALIRLQKDEDRRGKNKYRPSGKIAINNISERIKNHENDYNISLFIWVNVISCLQKVFENGDDFKNQPEIINRNFLDHGMLERNVDKKDCLQMFILIFNMYELFELFDLFNKEV